MGQRDNLYRPLFNSRWFRTGRTRVWQAPDHLLFVHDHFFSETYTRLYWIDIQSILLFQLRPKASAFTLAEAGCVLTLLASLLLWRVPWMFVPAFLFAAAYALWRFSRPSWACEIATRITSRKLVLPGKLAASRRATDELKRHTSEAQGAASAAVTDSSPPATATPAPARQPVLAIHVIVFVLGVISAWNVVVFALYCLGLAIAYLMQQDFRFPFAVRSAAVMSQMLAVLQIGFWIFAVTRPPALRPFDMTYTFEHWQFALPRVLFSLYGIAAVFWGAMEFGKPQPKSSTVLGLS